MSNLLESDTAMVMNLEKIEVDDAATGSGYDETETEPPSSTTVTPQ